MLKESKFTLELSSKEVSKILLDKYKKQYPEANLSDVKFDIGDDPKDNNYSHGGYIRQVVLKITVEGVIKEKI